MQHTKRKFITSIITVSLLISVSSSISAFTTARAYHDLEKLYLESQNHAHEMKTIAQFFYERSSEFEQELKQQGSSRRGR